MKAVIAIAACAVMLGTVPAAAYHLIPESSDFTGTGKTSATKNGVSLPCKAKFTGHTDANGNGFVDSGTFSGQVGCSTVGLVNLPWKGVVKSATVLVIQNVEFTSPIGNCGPGNLKVKLTDGIIKFTNKPLPGGCTVSGKITTSPTLSIVP